MEILGIVSIPTYILVAAVVGLATYWHYRSKYSHFSSQGIRGPVPVPFMGTTYEFFTKGGYVMTKDAFEKYGKYAGLYEGGQPVLMTCDKEILREVMVKDFNTYPNRRVFASADEILNNMMSLMRDDAWKRVRSLLTPTFSTGKLKLIATGVNECGKAFVENLGDLADKGEDVELREICGNFTMDVLAKTGFGIDVNSQKDPDSEFVKNAKKIIEFKMTNPAMFVALFMPWTVPILKKWGFTLSFFDKGLQKYFIDMIEQIINSRKAGDTSRQDLMQLIVNAHNESVDVSEVAKELEEDGIKFEGNTTKQKALSKIEMLSQGFLFFLAGFDNTAGVLSVLLHTLACHPEVQEKAQQEVDEVLGGKDDIDYADLQKLTYLEQCLQECLRIYPPAPRVDRECSRDVTIKGIFMPKGSYIGINILACEMNPDVWPEPEVYNPDRFSPEEKARRDPYDHIPFGYGPRNCIAMRFALMEIIVSAALVLKHFTIVSHEKSKFPLIFNKIGALKVKEGVWAKVQRR